MVFGLHACRQAVYAADDHCNSHTALLLPLLAPAARSTPNAMADALQAAAAADQLSLLMAMQQHQQQSQLQAAAAAASAAAAAMPPMPLGMGMPSGATVDQLQMLLNNPAEMNRWASAAAKQANLHGCCSGSCPHHGAVHSRHAFVSLSA